MKPWWTDSAIEMIGKYLKPTDIVFEFGAGNSTLWLAERMKAVVSVESNEKWYQYVLLEQDRLGIKNILIELHDITSSGYMEMPLKAPDEELDLVIIDGSFRRVEAFQRILPKVKKGGLIFLDDSQNISWLGCFHIKGIEVVESSVPDAKGKTATIFRRV